MLKLLYLCCWLFVSTAAYSQTNISLEVPEGLPVLLGNYNPTDYAASNPISDHDHHL